MLFVSNADKANILTEALPYIQKYKGKTIVIKYGGNAMINEGLKKAVISDIVLLTLVGIHVVLVHGGGPEINEMLEKIGKESRFVNGLRYTDDETMEIVQMVLAGKINKDLVLRIEEQGAKAIGLCGLDGGMMKAVKLSDGNDYGNVGEIVDVDISVIQDTIEKGYIPVISTIAMGVDAHRQRDDYKDDYVEVKNAVYNMNADTAAAKIASALGAQNLILLTDVCGIMRDPKDPDTLISVIYTDETENLIAQGVITDGMIPKARCCVESVEEGVGHTHIIDGRITHSILIEMLSDEGIGTMFMERGCE